jgi:hypothetical protein
MSICKIEHLEEAFLLIKEELNNETEIDETEIVEQAESNFEQFGNNYNRDVLSYCLEKYINAELDFTTPGDRGIGRVSLIIPRYGAYFRKQLLLTRYGAYFRKQLLLMSKNNLIKLYNLIQDIILRGYLVHLLFMERPVKISVILKGEEILEKWIPGIYSQDLSKMPEPLQKIMILCTNSAFTDLEDFMVLHNMKGGGFLSKDKTNEILCYYPFAGYGLRLVETRGY